MTSTKLEQELNIPYYVPAKPSIKPLQAHIK